MQAALYATQIEQTTTAMFAPFVWLEVRRQLWRVIG